MSLGAGLAFLCRFMLWLYLRTAHTHALKIGSSAKDMIDTQRRRQRRSSRHRGQPGSSPRGPRNGHGGHGHGIGYLIEPQPSP